MKKIISIICLCFATVNCFAQSDCEKRETKLLEAMGSFSASALYCTYGMIGGISDGYAYKAYEAKTVNDLMDSQEKLADNLVKVLEDLVTENTLKDVNDKNYAATVIGILKGLKKQAQLLVDYVQNKTEKNMSAYDDQRKENWKGISKLMGLDDK